MGKRTKTLLVILVALVLLPGGTITYKYVLPHRPNLSFLANICGIRFPTSAAIMNSRASLFNQRWHAVVRIDRKDVPSFLDHLSGFSEISRTEKPASMGDLNESWWNPGRSHKYAYVLARPPGHFPTQLLVALDAGPDAIVYVYHSQ